MNYDTAICFAYRIRSEVGYGTVGRLFIFFGCTLPKGIARVFSTISLHYGDDVSPTHIEEGDPLRPRPVALDLGAVPPFLLPRNQRPSTDKPILYRLFLSESVECHLADPEITIPHMVSTVRNFIRLSHRAATQRQSNAVAFRVPATRFSQGPLPGPSALSRTYMLKTSVGSLAQPFLLVRRYIDLATRIAALNATSNRALASGAHARSDITNRRGGSCLRRESAGHSNKDCRGEKRKYET